MSKGNYRIGRNRYAEFVYTGRTPATPTELLYKLLATSSGGVDMAVTASSAAGAVVFSYAPSSSTEALVERCIFELAAIGMEPAKFAGLSTGLANGLLVQVQTSTGGTVLDFLDGQTITRNRDFSLLAASDTIIRDSGAAAEDHMPIRWTIGRSGYALLLTSTQRLAVTVRDNISSTSTGVSVFRTVVQGRVHEIP